MSLVIYFFWDLPCYTNFWLYLCMFGEFGLLLIHIILSSIFLNFDLYPSQITFSSLEHIICSFKVSKLYISLDFKCFLPQNSMEKLFSFGIITLLQVLSATVPVRYDLATELWTRREQHSECSNITFFSFLKQIWYLQKVITYFWIQLRKINHLSYWNFRNIILIKD